MELGGAVAEIECGRPRREAIEDLRSHIAGAEVGGLAAALERSQAYGSPLAEQPHLQATNLRADARRRVEEQAPAPRRRSSSSSRSFSCPRSC